MAYNIHQCSGNASCICWSCHIDRLRQYDNEQPHVLLQHLGIARDREIESLDITFAEVLKQIAISKAFRQQIYAEFRYTNTASYFKGIWNYSKEEAKRVATPINHNCTVYDNFHRVLANLGEFPVINIKRLNTEQLYQSLDYKWCLMQSNVLRAKQQPAQQQQGQRAYNEADFIDLVRTVKSHPAYCSINRNAANNYGKKEVSALLYRLHEAILSGQ